MRMPVIAADSASRFNCLLVLIRWLPIKFNFYRGMSKGMSAPVHPSYFCKTAEVEFCDARQHHICPGQCLRMTDPNCHHPRGMNAGNASGGVFHTETLVRRHAEGAGGGKKDLGIRLGATDQICVADTV